MCRKKHGWADLCLLLLEKHAAMLEFENITAELGAAALVQASSPHLERIHLCNEKDFVSDQATIVPTESFTFTFRVVLSCLFEEVFKVIPF